MGNKAEKEDPDVTREKSNIEKIRILRKSCRKREKRIDEIDELQNDELEMKTQRIMKKSPHVEVGGHYI